MQHFSLQDLYNLSEGQELECKAAQGRDGTGELPHDFWKTYSAMANTDGGLILLGIQEKPIGHFRPIGIQNPEKILTSLWNNLNNRKQISQNLLINKHVETVLIEDKTVIIIHVPRATRQQRPVHLGENPFGGTYLRRHEGDYQADDETVRRILAERVEDSRDEKILKGFGMADLHLSTIDSYRNRFSAVRPNHPWIDLPLPQFLDNIGAFGTDRETGQHGLRLAGLLMFGRSEMIVDALPHYMLDYQERPEAKTERRWIDRITPDGTWSGNVYDFFRRVYPKLTQDLPIPFQVQEGQRIEDTPVHTAIREALVNALIHADYSGRVSILIVKRPDLFGFRNAGLMRLPLELALMGGHSDCRNRRLQTMFQLVGYGDKAGSGIPTILHGWQAQHWRRPLFQQIEDPEQTQITLKMASLLPVDVLQDLQKQLGKRFNQLSELERIALATAAVEGSIKHARIKEMCVEHSADITKMLTRLVQDGLLQADGVGRGKRYQLPWQQPKSIFEQGASTPEQRLLTPEHGALAPEQRSLAPEQRSLAPEQGTLTQLTPAIISDIAQLTPIEQTMLQAYAAPVANRKRVEPSLMQEAILNLCRQHYLGLRVLAHLLKRDGENLRKTYLNEMIKKGQLIRSHPDSLSDPRQAYHSNPTHQDTP